MSCLYDAIVAVIEETRDLYTLSVERLMGSLQFHEKKGLEGKMTQSKVFSNLNLLWTHKDSTKSQRKTYKGNTAANGKTIKASGESMIQTRNKTKLKKVCLQARKLLSNMLSI